jgi:hypothetical protein
VCNVGSFWLYIGILLGAHYILHINKIRVNIFAFLLAFLCLWLCSLRLPSYYMPFRLSRLMGQNITAAITVYVMQNQRIVSFHILIYIVYMSTNLISGRFFLHWGKVAEVYGTTVSPVF